MLYHINRLILPLIISNIIHMVVIKKGWLPSLAVPISTPLFGANKTWRGFIVLPILNGFMTAMLSLGDPFASSLLLGAALGFVYMLFELPN
ncbi:MAG: hypothetical protein H7X80_09010, partial [bacterium]|nr:hypothetical protein [Candidatus Kapabacteria bacterium]